MTSCSGALGTGTLYSYAQLQGLWINAGGSKSLAPVMAAIAEAESGGCSTAYNPSGATGLWQILGAVDASDQGSLTDPAVNAKEAVLKYQTQGLTAWTTYTSGAYKAYLNGSTTPDTNVPSGQTATLTSSNTNNSGTCLTTDFPHTSWCPMYKSEARGAIGGLLMGCAGVITLIGCLILAASAFEHSGAARAANKLTGGKVPAAPEKPPAEKPRRPAGQPRKPRETRPVEDTRG